MPGGDIDHQSAPLWLQNEPSFRPWMRELQLEHPLRFSHTHSALGTLAKNHTMLQNFNKSVCLLPRAPGWYAADANSGCTAVGSISRSSPHRHALSHTLWAARNFSHEVTTAPHGPPITARSVTAWNPRALEVAHGPLRAQKSREVFSPPPSQGPPIPGKTNLPLPKAASQRSLHQSSAGLAIMFSSRRAVRSLFLLSTDQRMALRAHIPCPNWLLVKESVCQFRHRKAGTRPHRIVGSQTYMPKRRPLCPFLEV